MGVKAGISGLLNGEEWAVVVGVPARRELA